MGEKRTLHLQWDNNAIASPTEHKGQPLGHQQASEEGGTRLKTCKTLAKYLCVNIAIYFHFTKIGMFT